MRILLVSIVAIIIGSSLMGCAMSTAGQNSVKFRFEDYRDEKSLVEALSKLHPAGSSVDDLLVTLKKAGASCETPIINGIPKKETVICSFSAGRIVTKDWQVGVNTHDEGRRISFIYARFYLTGP